MPVLLDATQALALDQLMLAVQTDGVSWEIKGALPVIAGLAPLSTATQSELSFLANPKYVDQLLHTQAAAVILSPKAAQNLPLDYAVPLVLSTEPYLLFAKVAQWFDAQLHPVNATSHVHPSAVIAEDVVLADGVQIGPHVVIESRSKIGRGVVIDAGCYVGPDCIVGDYSHLYPRVTLCMRVQIGQRGIIHSGAVIAADGFGFAPNHHHEQGAWDKIPQFGGVVMGNDVEIGANTTIDRGALDNTVLGNGVKLDNQIQIGHNTRIGDHTAMAGCTGIAGSTVIGQRCSIGGSAMIGGHLQIVDDVFVSGGTLVMSSIESPGQYTSIFPLFEHKEWERNAAVIRHLSKLRRRVQALEKK